MYRHIVQNCPHFLLFLRNWSLWRRLHWIRRVFCQAMSVLYFCTSRVESQFFSTRDFTLSLSVVYHSPLNCESHNFRSLNILYPFCSPAQNRVWAHKLLWVFKQTQLLWSRTSTGCELASLLCSPGVLFITLLFESSRNSAFPMTYSILNSQNLSFYLLSQLYFEQVKPISDFVKKNPLRYIYKRLFSLNLPTHRAKTKVQKIQNLINWILLLNLFKNACQN